MKAASRTDDIVGRDGTTSNNNNNNNENENENNKESYYDDQSRQ